MRNAQVIALAGALAIAPLAGCATQGSVSELEARLDAMEGKVGRLEERSGTLESRLGAAVSTAEESVRRAQSAEMQLPLAVEPGSV